jgi:hypothetical protein
MVRRLQGVIHLRDTPAPPGCIAAHILDAFTICEVFRQAD